MKRARKKVCLILLVITIVLLAIFVSNGGSLMRWFRSITNHDLSHSDLSADLMKAKQLALAAANFHDTRKAFPWSERIKLGLHPELSWRAATSEYMEQGGHYQVYRRDEPWNSADNQEWSDISRHHFELSSGNLYASIRAGVNNYGDLSDEPAQTIMLIENPNAKAEQWMKPCELEIEEAVELIVNLPKGDSLLAATYDCDAIRIRSPALTGVTRKEIRQAFVPDDGAGFDLAKLQ